MKVWTAAVGIDGEARDGGDVAEITKMFGLSGWFAGMRPIVLWERPTRDLAINTPGPSSPRSAPTSLPGGSSH